MDLRALAMGVAFALIWASAFTSARVIVTAAPPLTALSLRFLISGLLGVALARALGQSWRFTSAQWQAIGVFGICQNALYLGLNFVAMQTVEASLAAIVASTMPLWVALAGRAALGERLSPLGAAGLAAGLAGVSIVMGARITQGADPGGLALCAGGVGALTVATLAVRGTGSGGAVLMVVGLQMLVGAAALGLVAIPMEVWEVDWSASLIAAFVYTLVMPGLVATAIWFGLVNRIGATRAATFHFLTPPFGVGIAALVLGEPVGAWDAMGVAVIAAGILAVQASRATAAR